MANETQPVRKQAFFDLFWGLILTRAQVTVVGFDLLPFLGYLLIARGLGRLSAEHVCFRKARTLSVMLVVLTLINLFPGMSAERHARFRHEVRAKVTGRLDELLPREIAEASRVSWGVANSGRVSTLRTGYDRGYASYSNGTSVTVQRYGSPGEAQSEMGKRAAWTRKKNKLATGSQSERATENVPFERRISVDFPDGRVVRLWWQRGYVWLNPLTWHTPGGAWSENLVYEVEGRKDVIEGFCEALQGVQSKPEGLDYSFLSWTRSLLAPVEVLAGVLYVVLTWLVCTGIMALARARGKGMLARTANWGRWIYSLTIGPVWLLGLTMFFAPSELVTGLVMPLASFLAVPSLIASLLVIGLMRRAAYALSDAPAQPVSTPAGSSDSTDSSAAQDSIEPS